MVTVQVPAFQVATRLFHSVARQKPVVGHETALKPRFDPELELSTAPEAAHDPPDQTHDSPYSPTARHQVVVGQDTSAGRPAKPLALSPA